MEIFIQYYWSKETRKKQVDNFINMLALDLYEKCKVSKNIDKETLENINLELCKTYTKKQVLKYINKLDHGSFQINLYEKDVLNIAQLANEFLKTTETLNKFTL